MKIVIAQNECFNVPFNIIKRYFELKGENIYFYHGLNKSFEKFYKLTKNPIQSWNTYLVTKDLGIIAKHSDIISELLFDGNKIDRTDLNFVKVVEELKPYNLKIVEIPDDVKWYICTSEEGYETIHEEHRIWY